MKCVTIVFGLLIVVLAVTSENEEELSLAEECDEEACKLPDCRCSSTKIPGGFDSRDTPQFVILTFDDAVHASNIDTYRSLYGRMNSNGCPAGISFYVSHEYSNYVHINELYSRGYEMALHSITHSTPVNYWEEASLETLMYEFADQRRLMAHFANIPADQISGVRMPFLQMAGNKTFQMMQAARFTYDISWPTSAHVNPGLWPYTLNYASIQDCMIRPCPTASLPGPWVLPIIAWFDLGNLPCSFVDACFHKPDLTDEEAWFQFILTNFERQYMGNRAPFGFYVHEWFISSNPAVRRAFDRFLDLINNLPDTFMVTAREVIEWTRNPVKLDEYMKRPCRPIRPTPCIPRFCGPLRSHHTFESFYMQTCMPCPRVYPWLKNPLGH